MTANAGAAVLGLLARLAHTSRLLAQLWLTLVVKRVLVLGMGISAGKAAAHMPARPRFIGLFPCFTLLTYKTER